MPADALQVPRPDGALLAVQVSGPADADALLLLQGQASSHAWWTGLRERHERQFRTITMDYRGTGRTHAPGGDLTTELLATDAVAVLDRLEVPQAHVYGTSMGGRVAQMLAVEHPARVRTLVLACTSPGGPHAVERSSDVRKALVDPDPHTLRASLVDLFYTPAWAAHARRSHLFGDPGMSRTDRQRHLRMSARHDAWDALPEVVSPTLVLHGAADRMTPSINADLIAGRIPGAEVLVHPTGRHGFFDEFADDLEPTLHAFWRRAGHVRGV